MNPGIDPKYVFWLGIVVSIELGIGQGVVPLSDMFPVDWVHWIKGWSAGLAFAGTTIMTALSGYSSRTAGPLVKVAVLAVAVILLMPGSAHAQIKTPQQIINDLRADNARLSQKAASAVGIPATDPATALPCDFKMLTKLTPENLIPTVKACLSDVNQKLVKDTQRALDSAHAYGCTVAADGTIPAGCKGDGDAINCLTPSLAIFKAGVQIPAQAEVPAVMSADGLTVITPEVMAAPAQDPGPILLYQKYGEFTQAGALTACQTWFNKPINATTAAGLGGAATVVGAAALLPK